MYYFCYMYVRSWCVGTTILCVATLFVCMVTEQATMNAVKIQSMPDFEDEDAIIQDLTCLVITGIEDPVRDEVSVGRH